MVRNVGVDRDRIPEDPLADGAAGASAKSSTATAAADDEKPYKRIVPRREEVAGRDEPHELRALNGRMFFDLVFAGEEVFDFLAFGKLLEESDDDAFAAFAGLAVLIALAVSACDEKNIAPPAVDGELACGVKGVGRMMDPEKIFERVKA